MPKRRPKQPKPQTLLLIGLIGLMLAGAAVGYWLYRRSSATIVVQGMGQLESFVKQQGFRMYTPPREGSWGVGTIVRFVDGRPELIMDSGQVLAGQVTPKKDRVAVADYSYRGTFASDGVALVPKLAEANVTYGDRLTTTVKFGEPSTQYLSLFDLQRRLNEIPELQKHFKGGSDLLVVTEVFGVSTLEYTFGIEQGGSFDSKVLVKELQAKMDDKAQITAVGSLIITFPMLLGYNVQRLEAVANSLGGGAQIRINELPAEQLEPIIRSRQPLNSDFQVSGLIIGLGNYPSYSERVGGKLTGYQQSVELVADRLKQLAGPKGPADVEVLQSRQAEGTDGVISRRQILDTVERFATSVKGQTSKDSNNLIVLYYFGHGLSEPLSRMSLIAPEDFVDQPDKEVRQVWQELILVHEIVRKLEQLPGQVLVLIDSCRSREGEKEIRPEVVLGPTLPPGVGQLLAGQDLLPWPNSFDGPGLVMFSSKDRKQALTVPHVMPNGYVSMVGPLAERFDQLWREAVAREEALSFADLVNGLTTSLGSAEPAGYASWRVKVDLSEAAFVKPRK